jgi:hypothetical protein
VKHTVALLRKCREAHRDLAQRALANARAEAIAAHQQFVRTRDLSFEARDMLDELIKTDGRGFDASWRESVLPGCEAFLLQRVRNSDADYENLQKCRELLKAAQAKALQCERALMRTDELQLVVDDETKQAMRRQEEATDEEFALTYSSRAAA